MEARATAITKRGRASLQAGFSDYSLTFSESKEARSGFAIRAVDGIAPKAVYIGAVHELSPGKHTVEVLAMRQRGGLTSIPADATMAVVEFTASPGVKYKTSGKIGADHAEVWISEVETGRVVSTIGRGALSTTETAVTPAVILPN